ncbi:MAG: beta-galactosidase, partial [Patescibacteria group bacterium]|nr:beta-galactosidase [Patescibacteria group bacterium]
VSNLGLAERPIELGATFSKHYAAELGLDWRETYVAAMDDLGIRLWRIPAYWDDIEPQSGEYDFSSVDWLLDEAAKREAKVILAVGRKLPRWPECHVPRWASGLDKDVADARILRMIGETVRRYSRHSAVVVWQVENEPFFDFGVCPPPDEAFLKREITLVHSLDSRPVMVTDSGELSSWLRAAQVADILGISTYRVVWSRIIGYFYWPITPRTYSTRALAVSTIVRRVIISELQAEPWSPGPIVQMPIDQQLKVMSPDRLKANVVFARRVGLSEAYLWGVEWWYWLKKQGHPEMWEMAKTLYQQSASDAANEREPL